MLLRPARPPARYDASDPDGFPDTFDGAVHGTAEGWWKYFGGLLALFLAGLAVQLRLTAKGRDYGELRKEQRRRRAASAAQRREGRQQLVA